LGALSFTRSKYGPVTEEGALKEFEKLKRLELGSFTETGPKIAWLGV
jgi:hypothetical protein